MAAKSEGIQPVSKALYRKYRSKSLSQIVGQSHITDLLDKALKQNRVSHAYLLTGPRGVGKTSIARILAHAINGLDYEDDSNHLDIIEIDAASNNGVEDVRDLREKVQIAPVSASKKVYIIDEVHMLSKPAFNALLKTLEEPPEHVVFILATTDVDKLPATIISRTQRFSFRPIAKADMVKHLRFIADTEKIKISDEALEMIAEHGDGSFRDSISLLDQLANLAADEDGITAKLIEQSVGLADSALVKKMVEAIDNKNLEAIVKALDKAYDSGVNGTILARQLVGVIRQDAATRPDLLPLMDSLLDVPKSIAPDLKLLSVLGAFVAKKEPPKSAALTAAPALEIIAPIKELQKKAVQAKPREPKRRQPEAAPAPAAEVVVATSDKANPEDFNWEKLVEHTRQNYVAIYSVLKKCGYNLEGSTLTIYTGNKFYKKKLDDTKYAPLIHKSLNDLGVYELSIHTLPTSAPPKDSQAAAAFAIMGGGEEVEVDENVSAG